MVAMPVLPLSVNMEILLQQRVGALALDWIKWESDTRLFFLFNAERGDWETHVTEQTLYISNGCWIKEQALLSIPGVSC